MIRRRLTRAAIVAAGLAVAALNALACSIPLSAEARDQWKRTYTLAPGGSIEIRNTNGQIRVETTDGDTVDVVADRIARAGSPESAKTALGRIEISETATPNHILLDSAKGGIAFEINVSKSVDYVVRVPRWAAVTLSATNGEITVRGMNGALRAETTNGRIDGTDLAGPVHVSTTNGDVTLAVTKITDDGLSCETTNGDVELTVPKNGKASLDIQTNNGDIDTAGMDVSVSDKSRHELKAQFGGGGPKVKVETTNGDIRIKGGD